MHEYVFPNEAEFTSHQSSKDCWTPHPLVEEIKVVLTVSCSFHMPFSLLERVHLQIKWAKPAFKALGRGVGRISDLDAQYQMGVSLRRMPRSPWVGFLSFDSCFTAKSPLSWIMESIYSPWNGPWSQIWRRVEQFGVCLLVWTDGKIHLCTWGEEVWKSISCHSRLT